MIDFDDIEAAEKTVINATEERCAKEQKRPAILWPPEAEDTNNQCGILYGLHLPDSARDLQMLGPKWLTLAFRAAHTIPPTGEVCELQSLHRVKSCKRCHSMELLLKIDLRCDQTVEYMHLRVVMPCDGDVAESVVDDELRPSRPPLMADRFREINFYRLCEAGVPFTIPRFFFGDISSNGKTFLLITERFSPPFRPVPTIETQPVSASLEHVHGDASRHCFDYAHGGLGLSDCLSIVERGASFAGMAKAGHFGAQDELKAVFKPMGGADVENNGGTFSDSSFIANVSEVQDLIYTVAPTLWPGLKSEVPELLRDCRAVLVAMQANDAHVEWYMNADDNFTALGLNNIDIDDVFHGQPEVSIKSHSESPIRNRYPICIREWHDVSISGLGAKLWGWVKYAEKDVLIEHFSEILELCLETFHAHGGARPWKPMIVAQFVLAAGLEFMRLIGKVSAIYRAWPKQKWSQIKSLQDISILDRTTQNNSLWHCLQIFFNAIDIIRAHKCKDVLNIMMNLINRRHRYHAEPLLMCKCVRDTSVLKLEPPNEPSDKPLKLKANIFEGNRLWATGHRKAGYVKIKIPCVGWVHRSAIEEYPNQYFDDNKLQFGDFGSSLEFVLSMMQNTRRSYFQEGANIPSNVAAAKNYDEFMRMELIGQYLSMWDWMPIRVVRGSFKAQTERKSWWPPAYEHWAHHSWVAFGDGTIADIAADQLDESVPELWWPADTSRYSFSTQKADAAYRIRFETVGIEEWKKQVQYYGKEAELTGHEWWCKEIGRVPTKASRVQLLGKNGQILRHRNVLPLPRISQTRLVQDGRLQRRATFRRLTAKVELDVFLVENIFQPKQLQRLISCCEARNGFRESLVSGKLMRGAQDSHRTSYSCGMVWHMLQSDQLSEVSDIFGVSQEQVEEEFQAVCTVTEICAQALEVEPSRIEPLQIVKYEPGQFFKPHLDAHKEPDRVTSYDGEQRTHTFLVFLCDIPESDLGGHLHFPHLGLRVLPRFGTGVLWRNAKANENGCGVTVDDRSLHEGEPTLDSAKLAMNVWITDRPLALGSMAGGKPKGKATSIKKQQGETDVKKEEEEQSHVAGLPLDVKRGERFVYEKLSMWAAGQHWEHLDKIPVLGRSE